MCQCHGITNSDKLHFPFNVHFYLIYVLQRISRVEIKEKYLKFLYCKTQTWCMREKPFRETKIWSDSLKHGSTYHYFVHIHKMINHPTQTTTLLCFLQPKAKVAQNLLIFHGLFLPFLMQKNCNLDFPAGNSQLKFYSVVMN